MQAQLAPIPPPVPHRTGVLVTEQLALVRDGLMGLLAGWPHGPVRSARSLEEATARLDDDEFCVLLLDVGLAGPAMDDLRTLRRRFTGLRVVVMAQHESRDAVLQALAAGAHGFVAKTAGFDELARAIEVVRGGGVHVPRTMAEPEMPTTTPASILTGRQRDVLRLLAEGRSTKDIARSLDLAVSTIKVHLAAVYRTFGARNRVEALCRAGALPMRPAAMT